MHGLFPRDSEFSRLLPLGVLASWCGNYSGETALCALLRLMNADQRIGRWNRHSFKDQLADTNAGKQLDRQRS